MDPKARDRQLIWHPFTPLSGDTDPLLIKRAEGIYLYTDDNRKIIDAISSWWVNIHGHSHPDIVAAIETQARRLDHVIFAGFTHDPAIELAENLLQILPGNQCRVFFSDNGSTAVEVALKMAVQFWQNKGIDRRRIITLDGAYHGDTFGAMSVGERGLFTRPFANLLFDVDFIHFPTASDASRTVDQFKTLVTKGDVAAFIYEPLVQGAGGMRMYSAAILNELLRIAHSHDVVCIADEVFTGFGRTGKYFASNYVSELPDIVAVSKGITGGTMPLAVTSCSDRIQEVFRSSDFSRTFFHGHSYTANPIACAVANASFDLLTDNRCSLQREMIAQSHQQFVTQIQKQRGVSEARALGTIFAIDLGNPEDNSYTHELRKKIYPFFLERNILLRPLGNTIYILPPYAITKEELNVIYKAIEEFLETI